MAMLKGGARIFRFADHRPETRDQRLETRD